MSSVLQRVPARVLAPTTPAPGPLSTEAPPAHGPSSADAPLGPAELVALTRFYADEVRSGQYPYLRYDDQERWHLRLYRDRRVDIWLISWLPSQGTQLHDHGGSAGALTVVGGELSEAVFVPAGRGAGSLRERVLSDGRSVGFDAAYVHDVSNASAAPAASVHAYSRPLTSMTFYDLQDGRLARLGSLATEDPEPEFDGR